ncbi:hypothetical protein FGIG_00361 [Fasciola gigantica]|uniref:Tegument antigen n=1 Tax=Fasciola gigantica TaxID=46835 RepID=A0A504Y475_FASGI|nr:hypothetical protein FGIG_00361 [Fasciola gigantica]
MDNFLEIFFKVNTHRSKIITKTDLIKFAEENEYEESMPETWMSLFDPNNTGQITLQAFCDKLGLDPECQSIKEWERESQSVRPEVFAPTAEPAPFPETVLQPERQQQLQSQSLSSPPAVPRSDKTQLPQDAEVIFAQMPEPMKASIYEMAYGLLEPGQEVQTASLEEICQRLKSQLDKQYGLVWTVVIVQGSYWITHTHREQRTFHFRVGNQTVIAWQNSPGQISVQNP